MKVPRRAGRAACRTLLLVFLAMVVSSYGEVMLQWFETEWDEMYLRTPEVAEAGYAYIWTPPPTKAPTGLGTKWGNVGYSLYDRFDLGDVPQRGSWATRYGTGGSLRNMVNQMHQCDVKIIPDIVMNHTGNGPDIREYPGMRVTDFHVWYQSGYCNGLNYKRAPRMTQWTPDNGYGATMYEDLCNPLDIRTEDNAYARN
ncbi:MAG: alpha-amylase family glycosyl hydrolase, partial [Planctomycetota bacterium]